MESRKSHCYKPTSEMDFKESHGQTEYDQPAPVQQKRGFQQSRKAANVKNSYRKTHSSTTQFPLWQGALQATEGIRCAALHWKGIQHLCRCNCLVFPKHERNHNRPLAEARKRAFLQRGYCIINL